MCIAIERFYETVKDRYIPGDLYIKIFPTDDDYGEVEALAEKAINEGLAGVIKDNLGMLIDIDEILAAVALCV